MIDVAFALTDHDGTAVTPESYRGKWMLVFFGFTHCKVVCPRNLNKLSTVLDLLGHEAEKVAPLYISVDPERDTPDRMRSWLAEHYPRFTGLTGSSEAIDAARTGFRVFAQRRELPEHEDGYDVPHTALTYLIDPKGRYRTHFSETLDATTIAARMTQEFQREKLDA